MAVANITFDYGQILALVQQLPLDERQRLCSEAMNDGKRKSFASIFSRFGSNPDMTAEEIQEECDIVSRQVYGKYREAR